jgi:hypothetical protein
MPPPDTAPQPTSRSLVSFLRLIGALAVLMIAVIAALVVLDVLPDEILARATMKIVIVAGIAAAALGVITVLLPPRS